MDFDMTDEQRIFADMVRNFALRNLKDGALERAHKEEFPKELKQLFFENGLLGITISEEDGGQGGTLMDAVLAIEQIAAVCPRSADIIQEGNFGAIRTLAQYASPDQKERFLKPILEGREVIAVGMTEPDAGSATTDLKTTATPEGNGFRVNGAKVFPNPFADTYLVYVRFGPGVGGIGSVMLRRDTPGFTFGKTSQFMSGAAWAPMFFDNVFVPPEDVLLHAGGFKKQIAGFNAERIGNAARSLAYGRYCFEAARQYAIDRVQFGRPLCEFQGLQWKFADMVVAMEAAQLLLYRAASKADRGLPSPEDTTVAKLMCNRVGFDCANEAVQIMGGMGYSRETLVEYCFRRSRGWMIAGGSIEMLKNRLGEMVFERRFSQRPPRAPKTDEAGIPAPRAT
jgi:alkylation response protein AidB-like acyl-CoA dehydrogenase